MGKKNLDKLFQEKLKDFSEIPDDKVWQSIETSLDKKKRSRRVIPIWWKLGGVAAVLLLAVILINPFEDKVVNTPTVTDVNSSTEKTSEEKKTEKTFENQNSNENQIADFEQKINSIVNGTTTNQVVNPADSKNSLKSNTINNKSEQNRFKHQTSTTQVVNSGNLATKNASTKNETIVSENNFEKSRTAEIVESGAIKSELEKNLPEENRPSKANQFLNEIDDPSKEGIAQVDTDETPEITEEESKKKSIFDEIAGQQEEEEAIAENTGSKWSAGPSVAPVYFDALGEGSPVHSIFVPNSKSGDLNLSYGLSVAYELNKKLSIRSGIHKVDYGYRTNDVEFSSSFENATSSQIDNIDYTATSVNLVVSSKVSSRVEALNQNPFLNTTSQDVSAISAARDGTLEQQFGYLEVPLELNYALVDKRFGINLIGGISSLFLVDNSVSLSSGELTTDVGEANNINSVNFSTNVGFGMNYKVTPNIRLNIEPVFKYQLNTFSETEGTFNPFSVGVYSGLSFQF